MDIQKEMMRYTVSVGKSRAVVSAEADVIVPDSKPDAEVIIQTDTDIKLNGFEVQTGRVLVYGTAKFNILYCSPEGEIKNVKTEAAFTDVIEIPGTEPGDLADVTCSLIKTDCRILNGRKLSVKSGVNISAEVIREEETEVVLSIGEEAVEERSRKLEYIKKNPISVHEFNIKEQAEISGDLPQVSEILRCDGKISNKNMKIINNKVIVKADLDITVLYLDEIEQKPYSATVSLPFTEILEIDGITDDWILLQDMRITGTDCIASEDATGERRILELETTVESYSVTAEKISAEVLSDCYGISKHTETVKQALKLLKQTGEIKHQSGLKIQMQAEENSKIGRIYDVSAKAYAEGIERSENELFVKGKAEIKVMYIAENSKADIGCITNEVPFNESLRNVSYDCDEAEISAAVSGLSYTLNSENSVEVRGNLEISGILTKKQDENFITAVSVSENEEKSKTASVTVYFAEANDSLWDIAKKYETSMELICEANGIKPTDSLENRKLIVPKYKIKKNATV